MIDTGASTYAMGAVLAQQQIDSNPNEWATIGDWSRMLNQGEQNYPATKREFAAVL